MVGSDERDHLSNLRSSIHTKWSQYEDEVIGSYTHPERNKLFGALDALWDIDDALRGAWDGLPTDTQIAKLAAYGLLQALIVQQDAVKNLAEVILPTRSWRPHADARLGAIRVLRHRLSGHFAYAKDAGRTASIIDVRDRYQISGVIYGLDGTEERFPKVPIRKLISENAAGLIPIVAEADLVMNSPESIFSPGSVGVS